MSAVIIKAKIRKKTTKGDLNTLRKSGWVPGVLYGLNKDSATIQLPEKAFQASLKKDKIVNKIIELDIDGTSEQVILKEIVRHPIKTNITHIDFLRVNEENHVIVKVPIVCTGVPIGVKNQGGQFSIMKKFVKVKCRAQDIPEAFERDVTGLSMDTVIYARDIEFSKGQIITPDKTALYGVTAGKREQEAATDTAAGETAESESTDSNEKTTDKKAETKSEEASDKK